METPLKHDGDCGHLVYSLVTVDPLDLRCSDSVLRQRSKPVAELNIDVVSVVSQMIRALHDTSHARGISAIQMGIPARIIVVNVNRVPGQEIILIDPVILSISGRMVTRSEGCMSLPDYKAPLARRNKVTIQGFDLEGRERTLSTKGYEANVIQHEMDHLDGILYWDRLPDGQEPAAIL